MKTWYYHMVSCQGLEREAGLLTPCCIPLDPANVRFTLWWGYRLQSVNKKKLTLLKVSFFDVHSVLIDKSSKLTWTNFNQPDNFTISHQRFILFGADPLDPFVCNICGLSFMKKFLIRSHLMTVHEVWILIKLNN